MVFTSSIVWVQRLPLFNRSGGVQIPEVELTPRQRKAMLVWLFLYIAWFAVAFILAKWLGPMIWPARRPSSRPFFMLLVAPMLLIATVTPMAPAP